jgi:hypothetical protein
MKERDEAKQKGTLEGDLTKADLTEADLKELIPELRKKARDTYVNDRESKQMNLYKKILDANQKMFEADKFKGESIVDKLMKDITGGGSGIG